MSVERIIPEGEAELPPRKTHPTKKVAIKHAAVDVEMVPVVNWINSFDGAYTRHSCQGDDPPKRGSGEDVAPPYCSFCCDDAITLARIVKAFHCLATVEVVWRDSGSLEYVARFHSRHHLKEFLDDLRRKARE